MKKFRLLIVFSLILCCLAVFGSCNSLESHPTPTDVKVDPATLTLSWDEVKDVLLYTISITPEGQEAKEVSSSKTSYSLTSLDPGNYQIRVKALGKDEVINDSAWSEPIPFTREVEPGMVFTLINGNTEYEVTDKGLATGDIVIPETYRGKYVTAIGNKAFFNKSDVATVTMSDRITSIGDYAFANCSYVTSITLPANLSHIGKSAFASCRMLEGDLVIPEGVTAIPESAFSYCGTIKSVTLGSKVTTIGKNAFTDCRGITEVTIPDSVTDIGEYAFSMCKSVTKIHLGAGLAAIGPYAFSAMASLTKVTIPDNIKTLGEGAFMSCNVLADVELGQGIEIIDAGAFANTPIWANSPTNEVYVGKWFLGLQDNTAAAMELKADTVGIANYALYRNRQLIALDLPNSVKIIGQGAFAYTGLYHISIGSGVEQIYSQAFEGCTDLTSVFLGSYESSNKTLTASSLKVIESNAFKKCEALDEIIIPETVEVIGSYAFRDTGIYAASLDGVVYVGDHYKWVVDYTEELSGDVEIKRGTVGIANYAFYKCNALTGIALPNSIQTVGRAAFYECTALRSVELPNTLEVIEDYTFYHCDKLSLFSLPPALRVIGRSAFYKCGSLLSVDGEDLSEDTFTIPEGVTEIGEYAFYGCGEKRGDGLGNNNRYGTEIVVIGNSVKTIGSYAFYNFAPLKKVVLGNAVEVIGEKAFYKCEVLEEVTFGSNIKTLGNRAFYKCEALKSVVLPESLRTIGDYAFYKCFGLTTVDLGNGVTEIGSFAFYGCSGVTEVNFSSNLVHIGKQAFRNCKSLISVVLGQSIAQIDAHAFYGCDVLTLYLEGTKAGEEWHKYWNSSYRPAIWGCTLSEDHDYVVSFVKGPDSVVNKNSINTVSAPTRKGYMFKGWHTNSSATEGAYTAETVVNASDGRKLFAIWAENN
ncbi:MAG: leucine-rich repeat protein [Clostridia bacterium]|nr:leucine-rich repeat protein [Clostridia bacterium]